MEKNTYKIPNTKEELTEAEIEGLLKRERNLAIQHYLAPDLTDG